MVQIKRITDPTAEDKQQIRALEAEYFAWVNSQLQAEFQISLDVDQMLANDLANLAMYLPPLGGLFLAEAEQGPAGMILLTPLRPQVGQIRRMYVQPAFRRHGLARRLFETAVQQARELGYGQLLLESPRSWTGAHALYHQMGFEAVEMYPESEVPEPLRQYWVFMGLTL